MEWCEQNGVQYVFGLERNTVLAALVQPDMGAVETRWAASRADAERDYTETLYRADTRPLRRCVVAPIDATYQRLDTRYVMINISPCDAQWLYDNLYCAHGPAENLIKQHKCQLASDGASCGWFCIPQR